MLKKNYRRQRLRRVVTARERLVGERAHKVYTSRDTLTDNGSCGER